MFRGSVAPKTHTSRGTTVVWTSIGGYGVEGVVQTAPLLATELLGKHGFGGPLKQLDISTAGYYRPEEVEKEESFRGSERQ